MIFSKIKVSAKFVSATEQFKDENAVKTKLDNINRIEGEYFNTYQELINRYEKQKTEI